MNQNDQKLTKNMMKILFFDQHGPDMDGSWPPRWPQVGTENSKIGPGADLGLNLVPTWPQSRFGTDLGVIWVDFGMIFGRCWVDFLLNFDRIEEAS